MFENYFQAIKYLETIKNVSQPVKDNRSFYLPRMRFFLKTLGDPQKKLKYIHIAGTAGKGTIAHLIHHGLVEAKISAGLYTSPHLSTTIERIKVGKKFISPNDFAKLMETIKPAVDKTYQKSGYGRPSYYEILLAIAFLYFKNKKCRLVVLEAGIGGKNDASNIIPSPATALVNFVDYDHTKILGKTINDIAEEKAGIIKYKTDFYTIDSNRKKVIKIFKVVCQKNKANFNLIKTKKLPDYHQANIKVAQTILSKFIPPEKLKNLELTKLKIPGRFELMQKKPRVIIDGSHNKIKIASLIKNLKNLTYQRLFIIIALTKERNPRQVLGQIIKEADKVVLTRYLFGKQCWAPKELAAKLGLKNNYSFSLDPQLALESILEIAKPNDLILITGSFFLAGELRKYWISENEILKNQELKTKK